MANETAQSKNASTHSSQIPQAAATPQNVHINPNFAARYTSIMYLTFFNLYQMPGSEAKGTVRLQDYSGIQIATVFLIIVSPHMLNLWERF